MLPYHDSAPFADLDGDGVVGFADLSILAGAWLEDIK
jgi:hypothetical protein